MNFYPFHIGDYVSHTRHLTLLEDLAYRRLIDQYYLQEQPLPESIEKCAKLILMRDHQDEVRNVLEEFFELTPDGWISTRCDKEIQGMRKRQEIAREKANKRWSTAKADPQQSTGNAAAQVNDAAASKKDAEALLPTPTPTPLPTPITPTEKPPAALGVQDLVADGLTEQTATEWLAHRKRVKAPMTPRAWEGIKKQAGLAGLTTEDAVLMSLRNGWRGFESDWVKGRVQRSAGSAHSGFGERDYANSDF
jgi:uncharacterized protein YdaU (DUF1376 family)